MAPARLRSVCDGADTLGQMIEKHPGDLPQALAAWERELRPFVRKQETVEPAHECGRHTVHTGRAGKLFKRLEHQLELKSGT